MKLLIITQKVDQHDPVLGFFHRWLEEFARSCEMVTVIALEVGEYRLPASVRVFSLGKEKKESRFSYVVNFYHLLWQERKNYTTVFIHMNEEYVILGGLFLRVVRKKILFWRNHPHGTWLTNIAVYLSHRVFCTSIYSYTKRFAKTIVLPAGIDTDHFRRDHTIIPSTDSILMFGRLAPIKHVDLLLTALGDMAKEGTMFSASFVGDHLSRDQEYVDRLHGMVKQLDLTEQVAFYPGVSPARAPQIFNKHSVYVNLTPTGSFDKAILEAMASENLILTSNAAYQGQIDARCLCREEEGAGAVAGGLKRLLALPVGEKNKLGKELRRYVLDHHSLALLLSTMLSYMN